MKNVRKSLSMQNRTSVTFFLWYGLVCKQIHTGTTTFAILGDAVLKAELLKMSHDSPVGGYLGLYLYGSLAISQILLEGHVPQLLSLHP